MENNIENLLMLLCLIDWLADDLHYNSTGVGFYGRHLLADKVRDFGDTADKLKEAYYLGFVGVTPPIDAKIAQKTIAAYNKLQKQSSDALVNLKEAFALVLKQVEFCKSSHAGAECLPGGISAILDDVSERALTYKFLVTAEQAV